MVDWLGMNQGGVVHGMMDWSMMNWSMMDWSVMDWMVRAGMVDRSAMMDGSMTNTKIPLLPPSRVTGLQARLVSRDGLLHHLHLQLQLLSCGQQGQRDRQQRYEELLEISI